MATKTYCKSRSQELLERQIIGCTWNTKNKQPKRKTKELNGKLIPYIIEEEEDQSEILKNYKVQDFALENLIELGATNDLTNEQQTANKQLTNEQQHHNNVNKVNIEEIEQEEVTQLDTYNFVKDNLNIAEYKYLEQDSNTFGFIAQDVAGTKVGSKFIHKDNEGYLSYDSGAYVNILAGALKEAINKIEKLESEIKTLKANN